jgi:hypothetical protein
VHASSCASRTRPQLTHAPGRSGGLLLYAPGLGPAACMGAPRAEPGAGAAQHNLVRALAAAGVPHQHQLQPLGGGAAALWHYHHHRQARRWPGSAPPPLLAAAAAAALGWCGRPQRCRMPLLQPPGPSLPSCTALHRRPA